MQAIYQPDTHVQRSETHKVFSCESFDTKFYQYITGENPELVYVMKQWIQEKLNAFFFPRILKINC